MVFDIIWIVLPRNLGQKIFKIMNPIVRKGGSWPMIVEEFVLKPNFSALAIASSVVPVLLQSSLKLKKFLV